MRNLFFQVFVIAVLGSVALYFYNSNLYAVVSHQNFGEVSQTDEKTWPVRVETAKYGNYHVSQQIFGQVRAARVSNLSFQLSGCIADVDKSVRIGSRVTAGQILASFDVRLLELDLKAAEASVEELRSQLMESHARIASLQKVSATRKLTLDLFNRSLARQAELQKKKIVSAAAVEEAQKAASETRSALVMVESEISAARATLQTIRKRIQSARQVEDRARLNLQYAILKAPHDGVVADKTFENGTCIGAATPVLRLVDTARLEVELDLPFHVHRTVSASGPMKDWRIKALVGGEGIGLKVIRQAPELMTTQQMARVIAVPRDPVDKGALVPGQNLRAEVAVRQFDNVLKLPHTALFDEASLYSVKDGRLIRHKADILYRDNLMIYARADIPAGTPIIVTQLRTAIPGLKVTVLRD